MSTDSHFLPGDTDAIIEAVESTTECLRQYDEAILEYQRVVQEYIDMSQRALHPPTR